MKKHILSIGLSLALCVSAFGQKKSIEKNFDQAQAVAHLAALSSDRMMGRDPGRPEIKLAIDYISNEFSRLGLKEVPGTTAYLQDVPMRLSSPPSKAEVKMGDQTFLLKESLLVLEGEAISGDYELIDLGYGLMEDYAGKDVKGKIVITNLGAPNQMSPAELFSLGREKVALASKNGAVALIEMYNIPSIPWPLISNYLSRDQMSLDMGNSSNLPYIWLQDLKNENKNAISSGKITKASLDIEEKINKTIDGKNILGWIEGTNSKLKNEFILLSAHYDHVGVGAPDATGDSIYNGTRDNAIGTVSVMNAAQYFVDNPPKRSVLFALWTAEEKGLLGSEYFSENPLIPLNQISYNLNIDGAGYNDTSVVTVIGLERTTEMAKLKQATSEFGLESIDDPAPEQGLFDRSDNVNFAKKGIPSPTFSLGFTAFDDEINKYYHKAGDEIESVDLTYVGKYWKSYILAAEMIANNKKMIFWLPGDKYEEAGKSLYGIE